MITNATIANPIAEFSPGGIFEEPSVAAVINQIDGRDQMVFFIAWATEWSPVSNYLQHAYIHWMTRGICKLLPPTSQPTIYSSGSQLTWQQLSATERFT